MKINKKILFFVIPGILIIVTGIIGYSFVVGRGIVLNGDYLYEFVIVQKGSVE